MKATRLVIAGLATAGLALTLAGPAGAKYPEKPIMFVVPFGVGGGFDTLARRLAERWEKTLKVPVVIKSVPGSGGRRGSIRIFKSKPDGYTIGFTHFVPFLSDEFLRGKKPTIDYHKVAIIYQISQGQQYIFVGKRTPYKTVFDLKKAGRAIKFATTGIGAIAWVQANALASTVGFPLKFVTGYKKLADAALAVARGDAEGGTGSAAHFRTVKNDLRPILFLGEKRDKFYPNVVSAGELGFKDLTNLGSPRVVTAPPGTPESRLRVIRALAKEATEDPAFVKWATEYGFYMNPRGPKGMWQGIEVKKKIFKQLRALADRSKKMR